MIDLHSHFLPNIDDGAQSADISIQMLSLSKEHGVDICVGTPHISLHNKDSITEFTKKRQESIEELERAIKEKSGNFELPKLLYGAEVFIFSDISVYDNLEELCIGDTRYLLVELTTGQYIDGYNEWLYSLNLKGIIPIIAHIERYPYINRLISELAGVDTVLQINAKTVENYFSRKKFYKYCQGKHRVIVSSDMHDTSIRRTQMKEAYEKVKKHHPNLAEQAFVEIPKKILNI